MRDREGLYMEFVPQLERKLLRDKRTLILSGEIDSGAIHEFMEDLEIVSGESKDDITIILSSSGGEVESGVACIRAIKEVQKRGIKVIGSVYGHAMSMAFIVLQTCDWRVMGSMDILMAHGILSFSIGDMKNREAESKLLKFWVGEFAKLISSRCKNDVKKPRNKYSEKYWIDVLSDQTPMFFNGNESLEIGLVDEVR